jgi:hypothetical protein
MDKQDQLTNTDQEDDVIVHERRGFSEEEGEKR